MGIYDLPPPCLVIVIIVNAMASMQSMDNYSDTGVEVDSIDMSLYVGMGHNDYVIC